MSDHRGDPMWRLPAATAKRFGVKPSSDGFYLNASGVAVLFGTHPNRVIEAAMHGEFPPPIRIGASANGLGTGRTCFAGWPGMKKPHERIDIQRKSPRTALSGASD